MGVSVLLFAAPAGAASPVAQISGDAIAAAGSDTTENLMDQVLTCSTDVSNPTAPADCASGYNIHAQPRTDITVPGDAFCSTFSYNDVAHGSVFEAPQGSSAGRRALRDSANTTGFPNATGSAANGGHGCIDIARSSADRGIPAGTDSATSEYYAFALDDVTWGTTSLNAPAAITLAQLRQIYNCEITNWAELPGGSQGQIQRVMPQANSGTQATFINKVLGGLDPTTVTANNDTNPLHLSCPATMTVEENHGNYLTDPNNGHGGNAALYQQYIYPYSVGKWSVQANNSVNPTLDLRNGVRLGAIITVPSDPTSSAYGVRWGGSSFLLNNTGTARALLTSNGATTTSGSAIVSTSTAVFQTADAGVSITGAHIPAGAKILSVQDSQHITLTANVVTGGTGGDLTISAPVVSETNPNISDATDTHIFPGVRYLYNVLDNAQGGGVASYEKARCLVGFNPLDNTNRSISDATSTVDSTTVTTSTTTFDANDLCRTVSDPNGANLNGNSIITSVVDAHTVILSKPAIGSGTFSATETGAKSSLCNGDPDTATTIGGEGFLPLSASQQNQNVGSTCRLR